MCGTQPFDCIFLFIREIAMGIGLDDLELYGLLAFVGGCFLTLFVVCMLSVMISCCSP